MDSPTKTEAEMGILDRLKGQAAGIKDKATQAVDKNSDKIHSGLDKAGEFVDKKTKGKYHDKIDKAKGAAERGLDKLDAKDDDFSAEPGSVESADATASATETATPPPPPPAAETEADPDDAGEGRS